MDSMDNDRPRLEGAADAMNVQDFMTLGLGAVAYIKPVPLDDGRAFAIHAADGTRLAVLATREAAVAAARQNDMEPMLLH